jgi:hypothetical protein
LFTETITVNLGFGETNVNKQFILFTFGQYTLCPRIEFKRGKTFLFFILRKNFRGITFLLHLKPPFLLLKSFLQHRGRLNTKIKENAEKMFYFFFEKIKQ